MDRPAPVQETRPSGLSAGTASATKAGVERVHRAEAVAASDSDAETDSRPITNRKVIQRAPTPSTVTNDLPIAPCLTKF